MTDSVTGDIGGLLRRARQQRGLSLQDAATRTKLSIRVLQAIERNDFESLPGGIYRKGYLRSLAGEVGLDPKEIAAEYDKEFEPVTNPAAIASRNVSVEDQWAMQLTPSPRGSIVTLVILIALAIGWFAWSDGIEPPLPAATLAGELMPLRPLLDTAAVPIRRASALAAGTMSSSRIDLPLRIELAATDWCWVAAESDGHRALYRLVEPGERVVLEGQRVISLRLGNAGSVTLSINDGPPRWAGGDGEVVDVTLTPDNVEALRDGAVDIVSGDQPGDYSSEVRTMRRILGKDGTRQTMFNGARAQQLSANDYRQQLQDADAKYTRLLNVLITALGRHSSAVKPVSTK